jgi:hypothetical protein
VRAPGAWSLTAKITVGALAAATFVVSLIVGTVLFPHQSVNNDEAVYVYQANVILDGHLTVAAEPHRDFFRPWMSGEHDGRMVLVFQPVFPATLALSQLVFGTMRVAPAAIAAAAVVLIALFTKEVLGKQRTAVVAAALMALSPFAFMHGGLYLEYLYSVVLQLATLLLVLRGRRLGSNVRLVAAGLVMGLLFFMRPADALLLSLALGVYVIVADRREPSRVLRTATLGALGVLPFVVLCFAYNASVTGHALRFPLWVIGGNNGFGFGRRHIVANAPTVNITFRTALHAMRVNLMSFPAWFGGGVVALAVAFYGLWRLRHRQITVLLATIAVIVPLGYLFYWGNVLIIYGRRYFGPHYYLALLIPATVLAAHGLVLLYDERRRAAYVAGAAMLVATALSMPDKVRVNDRATQVAEREDEAIRQTVTDRAIVILPSSKDGRYVLHPRGWLQNPPDLNARVLYAADRDGNNVDLFTRFPDRSIYRLQEGEGSARNSPHRPSVRRLHVRQVDDGSFRAKVRATNQTGKPVAILYAARAYDRVECVLDEHSTAGAGYSAKPTLAARGVTIPCPGGDKTLPLPQGPSTVAIGIAIGPDHDIQNADLNEYRFWMRADGERASVITPPEQWRRDPQPSKTWCVTDGNPSISLTLD